VVTSPDREHPIYYARDLKDSNKAKWTKIGDVWPHNDDKGFSVELELMPVQNGRIHLREVTAKEAPAE